MALVTEGLLKSKEGTDLSEKMRSVNRDKSESEKLNIILEKRQQRLAKDCSLHCPVSAYLNEKSGLKNPSKNIKRHKKFTLPRFFKRSLNKTYVKTFKALN